MAAAFGLPKDEALKSLLLTSWARSTGITIPQTDRAQAEAHWLQSHGVTALWSWSPIASAEQYPSEPALLHW